MKKKWPGGVIFFAGFPTQAFASAGYAKDGLISMLFVAGFLLFLTGIIAGIDYLNKHGRMLFNRLRTFIRKKALAKFWDHFSGKEDMGDPPGVHPAF